MIQGKSILKLTGISKVFGKESALSDIDFDIKKAEVVGIIGANGSGKSTLLKIILGLIFPSAGTISGEMAETLKITALLERPGFFPEFTLKKNLQIFSGFANSSSTFQSVVQNVGLAPFLNKKYQHCSSGIKRRCELAAALLNNPDLLILDEPTNGLDPLGIIEFRELLDSVHKKGCTIILTSHILSELEKICNRICFIKNGVIQEFSSIELILKKFDNLEEAYRYYNSR